MRNEPKANRQYWQVQNRDQGNTQSEKIMFDVHRKHNLNSEIRNEVDIQDDARRPSEPQRLILKVLFQDLIKK